MTSIGPDQATRTGLTAVADESRGTVVEVTARLDHLCPHRSEIDRGDITLAWVVTDVTLEIHDLVTYLAEWAVVHISHEEITQRIWDEISAAGVTPSQVTTSWTTGGAKVVVRKGGAA